jgi:hypothetical protein
MLLETKKTITPQAKAYRMRKGVRIDIPAIPVIKIAPPTIPNGTSITSQTIGRKNSKVTWGMTRCS